MKKNLISQNNSAAKIKLKKIESLLLELGITHFASNDYDQYLFFKDLYFDERKIAKIIWDLEENNAMVEVMKSFNILEGCSIYIRDDIEQKIVSFHFGTSQRNIIKRLFLGEENVFKNFIYIFTNEMSDYLSSSVYFESYRSK